MTFKADGAGNSPASTEVLSVARAGFPLCLALAASVGSLERLTEAVPEGVEAEEGAAQVEERQVDVPAALSADGQVAEAAQPGQRPLNGLITNAGLRNIGTEISGRV
jgi:hypothetical protein